MTGRLTAAEAQAAGRIPPGHVWDDEEQRPVERGMALMTAQLERHVDLAANLEAFQKNRQTLMRFVGQFLQESDYDSKGYPIPGKLHDYYRVPGSENKALTKLGGEKLAQLFRFGRASSQVVATQETKEYVSATVEVTLVDQYRRPVGSAVSSCSTAEPGFRSDRARKKYGAQFDRGGKETAPPDFRAALNDVVARASKRAFVQSVIVATSADEVFISAEQDTREAVVTDAAPRATRARFPDNWNDLSGKYVDEVDSERLVKIAKWCRTDAKNPKAVAPILEAVEEELERRRDGEDTPA